MTKYETQTFFEEVMGEYGAALKRVAACYFPPGSTREDLEQEIALAIYQALPRFRHESSIRTYVYRIAHNCGVRALKQAADKTSAESCSADASSVQQNAEDPESLLLRREKYELLARQIRALPLNWRQPITMRLDGLSYKDIADILELDVSAVGVRIHRATKALQQRMKS